MSEAYAISFICLLLGGEPEARHNYFTGYGPNFIKVDCETNEYVIEIGLDKRSSFDSIHQAVFASIIANGKKPWIIIVDTDGIERKNEFQIRTVAEKLGVRYTSFDIFRLLFEADGNALKF